MLFVIIQMAIFFFTYFSMFEARMHFKISGILALCILEKFFLT